MFMVHRLVHNAEGIWRLGNASKNTKNGVNVKSWNGLSASSAPSNMPLIGNICVFINIVLSVQRITERLRNTDVSFAKINTVVK